MTYIAVCQTGDFVECTQVADILKQEGIPTRVFGPPTAGDIGISGFDGNPWRIEVPEDCVDEAVVIISAFLSEIEAEDKAELPWELRNGEDEGRLSLADPVQGGELALSDEPGHLSLTDEEHDG